MSDLLGVVEFLAARADCPRRGAAGHIATARPPGRPAVGLFEAQLRALVTTAGACFPNPPAGLFRRQLDMLELIASGMTNEQLAAAFGTHRDTAKKEVIRLIAAFGAMDRTNLVAESVLRGVLVRSPDATRLVAAHAMLGGT